MDFWRRSTSLVRCSRPQVLIASNSLLNVAAGLVCSLWDAMLTFSDEFEYIWRRRDWDLTRVSFLMVRYSNLAAMFYIAYGASANKLYVPGRSDRDFQCLRVSGNR